MTPPTATIRDMRPADVDDVLMVEQQTPGAPHWQRNEYEKLFEADGALYRRGVIASAEGTVVGFAVAKVLTAVAHSEAELETIVVRRDAQRRGTGGALLRALLERLAMERVAEVRLEVRLSNAAAMSLYKAFGFEETGVRTRYYHDPEEDAVLMGMHLPFPRTDARS